MAETDFIPTVEDKKFDTAPSLEKAKFDLTPKNVDEVIEKVVDYRGDVTFGLKDGTTVSGYVFNREPAGAEPFLEMMPADKDEKVRIPYSKLSHVFFSGIDTASGRSWAAWLAKYKAKEAAAQQAK